MKILNIGCGEDRYKHNFAEIITMDIDPDCKPDICMDIRELDTLEPEQFDIVFGSHILEHLFRHDGIRMLKGAYHVLKKGGELEIIVPDLSCITGRGLHDVVYTSPAGNITCHDMIYGHQREIEKGKEFYAHRTGFTGKTLEEFIQRAGFASVRVYRLTEEFALMALARKE